MRLLLNLLWFVFGGWLSGLLWLLGGFLMAISIVGLPWTLAAWRIAGFAFWPFGKEIATRDTSDSGDLGTGPIGFLLNLVWFVVGGWHIALSHLVIAFAEAITLIGVPFALKDLQLARLALAPVGTTVRDKP